MEEITTPVASHLAVSHPVLQLCESFRRGLLIGDDVPEATGSLQGEGEAELASGLRSLPDPPACTQEGGASWQPSAVSFGAFSSPCKQNVP